MLTLTDEGRAVLADARGARARVLQALMAQMDASERERLRDATEALAALLQLAYTDLPEDSKAP